MINNRQNGRRRGRGGPQIRNGAGGGAERGNRIDNRARGNAAQLHEKYRNLARDAQTQGDRVMTEYYLQFADHYFRVLSESRARFEEQQPRRQQADDYDDGGDDGDVYDANDRVGQSPRVDRYEQQRPEPRPDPRYEQRPDQRHEQRGEQRSEQPRRPEREEAAAASNGHAREGDAPAASDDGDARRPRRGRRPRRDGEGAVEAAQPERIEVDRLPPPAFLSEGATPAVESVPAADGEEAPRRRRPRRPKDDGDSVAA